MLRIDPDFKVATQSRPVLIRFDAARSALQAAQW